MKLLKRIILFLFLAAKILLASKTRDLFILLHDYILGRLSTRVKVNTATILVIGWQQCMRLFMSHLKLFRARDRTLK